MFKRAQLEIKEILFLVAVHQSPPNSNASTGDFGRHINLHLTYSFQHQQQHHHGQQPPQLSPATCKSPTPSIYHNHGENIHSFPLLHVRKIHFFFFFYEKFFTLSIYGNELGFELAVYFVRETGFRRNEKNFWILKKVCSLSKDHRQFCPQARNNRWMNSRKTRWCCRCRTRFNRRWTTPRCKYFFILVKKIFKLSSMNIFISRLFLRSKMDRIKKERNFEILSRINVRLISYVWFFIPS